MCGYVVGPRNSETIGSFSTSDQCTSRYLFGCFYAIDVIPVRCRCCQ